MEDAEALHALDVFGCTVAQGYHLSRPLPGAEFDRWYADANGPRRTAARAVGANPSGQEFTAA